MKVVYIVDIDKEDIPVSGPPLEVNVSRCTVHLNQKGETIMVVTLKEVPVNTN